MNKTAGTNDNEGWEHIPARKDRPARPEVHYRIQTEDFIRRRTRYPHLNGHNLALRESLRRPPEPHYRQLLADCAANRSTPPWQRHLVRQWLQEHFQGEFPARHGARQKQFVDGVLDYLREQWEAADALEKSGKDSGDHGKTEKDKRG